MTHDDGQRCSTKAAATPLRITPDQLRSAAPEVYQSYQALIQQNGGGEQNITINVEACPQSPSEDGALPTAGAPPGGAARRGMAYSDLIFYDLFEPEIGALYRQAWKREVTRQLGLDQAAAATSVTRTSGGYAGARNHTGHATRFGSERRALPIYPSKAHSSTTSIRRKRSTPCRTLLIGLILILMGVAVPALWLIVAW
jgi:hypothetical protein